MPKLEERRSARTCSCEIPPTRPQASRTEEELSEEAIRALAEGRADHDAGRTFTMAEIKHELGIDS